VSIFDIVEYAVTTVLSNVGAFATVIDTLYGAGIRVVFAVICVTTSTGWPITVGAKSYSMVRQLSCCCGSCLAKSPGFHAVAARGRRGTRILLVTFMAATTVTTNRARKANLLQKL
jgi:hypothetical protein